MTRFLGFNWPQIATLFIPSQGGLCERRYDLDWLRVIVFGLLIFYHTGMFYVENWGWHAKSIYQSQFLENIMLIVEPWRMPVLWLISGIAIRFIMVKVSAWRFIAMRTYRLLLPLLFGILVVVPPQLYVEMTYNGDLNMSYWQFLNEFFSTNTTTFDKYSSGIWPHIDVNHLWFIRSLWQYSLAILCMLPLLNMQWVNRAVNSLFRLPGLAAIVLVTLPLFIIQIGWEMSDVRYPLGFTLMVYGYLIGWNPLFWQRVTKNITVLVIALFICYGTLIIFYNRFWLDALTGNESKNTAVLMLGMFNYSLMRVLGVLVVFALAHKFLNVKSKKLSYFNDAVYPFYILHQTFILVIGYNLTALALGPIAEPLLLITLTTLSCFFGYEIIRRNDILRPLFGLKLSRNYGVKMQRAGYVAALLLTLPIGLKIIL
jgi:acyltransferase-like protein